MSFLTTRAKIKAAITRKKRRAADPTPPMVKLLRNGNRNFEVAYDAQWKTKRKAIDLGYIVEGRPEEYTITPAGIAYLASYDAP